MSRNHLVPFCRDGLRTTAAIRAKASPSTVHSAIVTAAPADADAGLDQDITAI